MTSNATNSWAYQRDANWAGSFNPHSTSALRDCWEFSRQKFSAVRACFHPHIDGLRTAFVVGSLARMEARQGSDCDLVMIVEDECSSQRRREISDEVYDRISRIGFEKPRADGIYAIPGSVAEMCDPANIGVVDESLVSFGHRILCLMESQPVFADDEFDLVQRRILQRYLFRPGGKAADELLPKHRWSYLLDDLVRYQRSYSIRVRWGAKPDEQTFQKLNIKLQFSRTVNYFGLLSLVLDNSLDEEQVRFGLRQTPLERIVSRLKESKKRDALELYNRYLEWTRTDDTSLVNEAPTQLRGLLTRHLLARLDELPDDILATVLI